MIYLSPPTTPILPFLKHPRLGAIITPDSDRPNLYSISDFHTWAADNGCFAAGERFDEVRYLHWLMGLRRWRSTCLFATAPDVVGDAGKTWERSKDWLGAIRVLGFKAALVAQDGINPHTLNWDSFDVLFIGGSDRFKLEESGEVIHYAWLNQKPVHVGRVNSAKRYYKFLRLGVTSCDGTFVKFGPDVNIPKVLGWVGS